MCRRPPSGCDSGRHPPAPSLQLQMPQSQHEKESGAGTQAPTRSGWTAALSPVLFHQVCCDRATPVCQEGVTQSRRGDIHDNVTWAVICFAKGRSFLTLHPGPHAPHRGFTWLRPCTRLTQLDCSPSTRRRPRLLLGEAVAQVHPLLSPELELGMRSAWVPCSPVVHRRWHLAGLEAERQPQAAREGFRDGVVWVGQAGMSEDSPATTSMLE